MVLVLIDQLELIRLDLQWTLRVYLSIKYILLWNQLSVILVFYVKYTFSQFQPRVAELSCVSIADSYYIHV